MKLSGWIFLIASWAAILVTTAWCMYKTLTAKEEREASEADPRDP